MQRFLEDGRQDGRERHLQLDGDQAVATSRPRGT
jgi:hypothetical protein